MSHVPARMAAVSVLATAPALVPAAAPSPSQPAPFVVVGPFLKITPGGGFLIRVKNGNEAGKKFLDHKVVFLVAKSTFVVDDVNGDGQHDAGDFTRGDKVMVTKKVVPPGSSGDDPQRLGPAKIR